MAKTKKILSCFGLSVALGILLFSNAWAEKPKETASNDGVHLVWQHVGERVGYLAYHVQSSKSGILELYWICNGLRDDSKQTKHSSGSGSATYIVNIVPNGPVEDTANIIVEKIPWEINQKLVIATVDWTEGGKREAYAGEGSLTVLTPEPRKNIYINSQKVLTLDNAFSKLPTDQPFKLLTFSLRTDNEQKPEIWELYGNWLSQDKLSKEFRETKSARSISWLLANAVRNGMNRDDVIKLLGPGTNPEEKFDKWFRRICEKQGLSLQKDDAFVMYDAPWTREFLQFRNGVLVNHKPEEYANPRQSWAMSIPGK